MVFNKDVQYKTVMMVFNKDVQYKISSKSEDRWRFWNFKEGEDGPSYAFYYYFFHLNFRWNIFIQNFIKIKEDFEIARGGKEPFIKS